MPLSDYAGMSDRDILVSVAVQQESLSKEFIKFSSAQDACNANIEDRVWELEVNGSKVSKDLSIAVRVIDKRLDGVEKACIRTNEKDTWWDSIYTRLSIIGGLILVSIGLLVDLYWRIRGVP